MGHGLLRLLSHCAGGFYDTRETGNLSIDGDKEHVQGPFHAEARDVQICILWSVLEAPRCLVLGSNHVVGDKTTELGRLRIARTVSSDCCRSRTNSYLSATTRLPKIPRTDGTSYKGIGTASRRLAACFLIALEMGPTVITEPRLTLSI
jgi:hypothetical protein